MKHKLLIAGMACAVGVAFAQVQPPSAGDPTKGHVKQAVDPWKVRAHEGIKGVAPTKPSAGVEMRDPLKGAATPGADAWRAPGGVRGAAATETSAGVAMQPAPVKPRTGYIDPENPENRLLAPKPTGVQRASPLAAPAKPLTPQGPLAAPNALPTPGVQK